MDWLIPAIFGLALFAARDARGLARFANSRLHTPNAAACGLEEHPGDLREDYAQRLCAGDRR